MEMTEYEEWISDGCKWKWNAPITAHFMLRLPLARHIRAIWLSLQVTRWYSDGPGIMGIPTGYDAWVLYGIRKGWV